MVSEKWRFLNVSNGGRSPSGILCDACLGPPSKSIWWSIVVQNLVEIRCVVLKICEFGLRIPVYAFLGLFLGVEIEITEAISWD